MTRTPAKIKTCEESDENNDLSVVSGKMEIKSFGCHLYTYTRSGYMGHVVQSLKSNKHKYIQTKDTLDY